MDKKLKIIQELMEELQEDMQYGEDDFADRLGKKKPGIEVVKIEGEMPLSKKFMKEEAEEGHDMSDMMGDEDEDEMEMEDEFDPEEGSFISKADPDQMLKKRLMKMRGK